MYVEATTGAIYLYGQHETTNNNFAPYRTTTPYSREGFVYKLNRDLTIAWFHSSNGITESGNLSTQSIFGLTVIGDEVHTMYLSTYTP